jgi:hypothetical protein
VFEDVAGHTPGCAMERGRARGCHDRTPADGRSFYA